MQRDRLLVRVLPETEGMTRKYVPRRRDANHGEIQGSFERAGAPCLDLSGVGDDCPDVLTCIAGINVLVEIKTEKGTLTPGQKEFFRDWPGPKEVARNTDDVIAIVNKYRSQTWSPLGL